MSKEFRPPSISEIDDLLAGAQQRFTASSSTDGVPSNRHDGMTAHGDDQQKPKAGRRERRRKPAAPTVPEPTASKFTMLLDPPDAAAFDQLALELRRRTGRRVSKADIVRALLALADDPDLVDDLARHLPTPRTTS